MSREIAEQVHEIFYRSPELPKRPRNSTVSTPATAAPAPRVMARLPAPRRSRPPGTAASKPPKPCGGHLPPHCLAGHPRRRPPASFDFGCLGGGCRPARRGALVPRAGGALPQHAPRTARQGLPPSAQARRGLSPPRGEACQLARGPKGPVGPARARAAGPAKPNAPRRAGLQPSRGMSPRAGRGVPRPGARGAVATAQAGPGPPTPPGLAPAAQTEHTQARQIPSKAGPPRPTELGAQLPRSQAAPPAHAGGPAGPTSRAAPPALSRPPAAGTRKWPINRPFSA
ncbi:collagen alpha-1(I) chain-like [Jatropha curcas]|uniref:collagen alpha-1(I) chain-like n=1 Tax=Jatropha curcas TaxID=180498 RepID=UPI001895A2F2|nr:collagen alpha-1(I) chain-like [Jatropha curcas]